MDMTHKWGEWQTAGGGRRGGGGGLQGERNLERVVVVVVVVVTWCFTPSQPVWLYQVDTHFVIIYFFYFLKVYTC